MLKSAFGPNNGGPHFYSDPQNHESIVNSIIRVAQFSRYPIIFISPSRSFYHILQVRILFDPPPQFKGLFVGSDWQSARDCLTRIRHKNGPRVPIVVRFIGITPWSPLDRIILDEIHQPIVLMGELDENSKPLTLLQIHSKIGDKPLDRMSDKALPGITVSGLGFSGGPLSFSQRGLSATSYAFCSFINIAVVVSNLVFALYMDRLGVSAAIGGTIAAGLAAAFLANQSYIALTCCRAEGGEKIPIELRDSLQNLPNVLPSQVTLSMEEILGFEKDKKYV